MVPEGAFRVWCETSDDMDAVCEALGQVGVIWRSGSAMIRWRWLTSAPCGVVVAYTEDQFHGAPTDIRRAYTTRDRTGFFSSVSKKRYSHLPCYTVKDIVNDFDDAIFRDTSSILSLIEY